MSAADPTEGGPSLDVVIVGGGMAGLSAAWRLRDRRILLLERSERTGGRVHSVQDGDYWLNFGAHMIGDAGSLTGRLVSGFGLRAEPIRGRLLGLSMDGRRLLDVRPESYPFRLPLPLRSRIGFIAMGLALRRGHARLRTLADSLAGVDADARRAAMLGFENARTLMEMIGPLPQDIAQLLTAFTERNGGDPAEMAAGHAIRSFANVWSRDAPGRNVVGGSALLPNAITEALGDRVVTRSAVRSVRVVEGRVIVDHEIDGRVCTVAARTAIVAVPAPVARNIVHGLPAETQQALDRIAYGVFLTAAVRTRERGQMPWDRNYAIATPRRRFSVAFNMATTMRGPGPRLPGGSLMLFRGALGAAALLDHDDTRLEAMFADDLVAEFPEARGQVDGMTIQRWELGAPFSRPGRAALQPALAADLGPVALAGDYLEFPNLEAAIASGEEAADRMRMRLDHASIHTQAERLTP